MPQGFYERICAFIQTQSAARTVAGKTVLLRTGETENRLCYIAGGVVQELYDTNAASRSSAWPIATPLYKESRY